MARLESPEISFYFNSSQDVLSQLGRFSFSSPILNYENSSPEINNNKTDPSSNNSDQTSNSKQEDISNTHNNNGVEIYNSENLCNGLYYFNVHKSRLIPISLDALLRDPLNIVQSANRLRKALKGIKEGKINSFQFNSVQEFMKSEDKRILLVNTDFLEHQGFKKLEEGLMESLKKINVEGYFPQSNQSKMLGYYFQHYYEIFLYLIIKDKYYRFNKIL